MDSGRLDQVFACFVSAALAGKRCPQSHELPAGSPALSRELARQGRIKIEISGHNYRTVEILTGPHAGKRTVGDPDRRAPWRVITVTDLVNGRPHIWARRYA